MFADEPRRLQSMLPDIPARKIIPPVELFLDFREKTRHFLYITTID
jgi:hypothetical protein